LAAELALAPTDVLIEELLSRCDDAVIVAFAHEGPESDVKTHRFLWKGKPHTCLGLVFDMLHRMQMAVYGG